MSIKGQTWKWKKPKIERKQSIEHIEKCRLSKIGKKRPDMIGNTHGFKKGQKPHNYGKETIQETKDKISKSHTGKILSKEHKLNIGKAGRGKKRTDQTRKKISISKMGDKNPSWNDGSSFGEYSLKFTNALKEKIRKRDNYICQRCGLSQKDNGRKLPIHHIDYNKNNCDEKNLITLCSSCHSKTNHNRWLWKQLLTMLINIKYIIKCIKN